MCFSLRSVSCPSLNYCLRGPRIRVNGGGGIGSIRLYDPRAPRLPAPMKMTHRQKKTTICDPAVLHNRQAAKPRYSSAPLPRAPGSPRPRRYQSRHLPPREQLRDLRPLVAEATVILEDDQVFFGLPGILADIRVEVIVPPATASRRGTRALALRVQGTGTGTGEHAARLPQLVSSRRLRQPSSCKASDRSLRANRPPPPVVFT